jgi:hypothetical protein
MAAAAQTTEKTLTLTKKSETLFVQDTTCKPGETRQHIQLVDGIETPFDFSHGKKTEIETSIAMKFLKTKEFVVTDHEGKRVEQTPEQPDEHARKPFVLRDNQVVAELSELTDEALWKRASQLIGGEKLPRDAGRGRFVAFLENHRKTDRLSRTKNDGGVSAAALAVGAAIADVS